MNPYDPADIRALFHMDPPPSYPLEILSWTWVQASPWGNFVNIRRSGPRGGDQGNSTAYFQPALTLADGSRAQLALDPTNRKVFWKRINAAVDGGK